MNTKSLAKKAELAKALGISIRAVDRLVSAKKIPSIQIGTRRLFDPEAVILALKSGVASPENGGLGSATGGNA